MSVKNISTTHTLPLRISDFNRYRGSSQYSGYLGIKNLFSLLKTDVKAALREYKIYLPKPLALSTELRLAMRPFVMYWNDWTTSNFCSLSSREVSLINLYRKQENLELAGDELDISYDVALSTLVKSIRKLQYSETLNQLQQWKNYKYLDISTEDFLDGPIDRLRHIFPNRVYNLLVMFGKTMREALSKGSMRDLRKYRQFGQKEENELLSILEKYKCLQLMKK